MPELGFLRRSLSLMRGNILVLSGTRMLGMFARSMTMPYASLYILALGGEPEQIGLVNSLAPLAGLLVLPIAGYLSDHSGRVKLIGLSGLLSGAVFLIYIFASTWEWIALGSLLLGFMVIQFPPSSAIIADSLAPGDRGRGIALMNAVAGAPALFAPYVAGALLDRIGVAVGMRYLYGVLMLATVISGLLNWRLLKETTITAARRAESRGLLQALGEVYRGIPGLLRGFSPSLRALAAIVVLGFVANALAGPFWVVYAVEHVGLGSTEWGSILLVETALRNVAYVPAGLLVDRVGRSRCMIGSLSICLVSVPLFVCASGFWPILLIRLSIAVANAAFTPACAALLADLVPRQMRGRVMAAMGRGTVMIGAASGGTGGPGLGFLVTVPLMIASFSAGYLYAHNPAYPWYVAFVAIALCLLLTTLYVRDPQQAHV